MATKLTPQQFINSWATVTSSKIDINAHRFVVAAAQYMQSKFKANFQQGGNGTPWATRTSAWGKRQKHRILNESGDLKNSMQIDSASRSGFTASSNVHTTASSRRKMTGDTSGYAAIHNSDPKETNYTVNGNSSKRPVQRQFIGFSAQADSHIALQYLSQILFDQIPH